MTTTDGRPKVARPGGSVAHFEMYMLGETVRWRLLSANNRDTGQSALGFASAEACQAGLRHFLDVIGEVQPVHTVTQNQRWQWQLALDNVTLARSSRSFDRRLRCEAACEWFIRMAPVAAIGTTLRIVLGHSPADIASRFDRSSPLFHTRDEGTS